MLCTSMCVSPFLSLPLFLSLSLALSLSPSLSLRKGPAEWNIKSLCSYDDARRDSALLFSVAFAILFLWAYTDEVANVDVAVDMDVVHVDLDHVVDVAVDVDFEDGGVDVDVLFVDDH